MISLKRPIESIVKFLSKPKPILGLYIVLALVLSFVNFNKGQTKYFSPQDKYTHYNNYVIFKSAFFHLKEGLNLYSSYPEEHWDLYKYSPSFAFAMMGLAAFPDLFGLMLWNLMNVLLLYYGLRYFVKGPPHTVFMLWFVFNESVTSVLNSQSNLMIAGLLVAAFSFFERDKVHWAALCIVSTFFIKIFGIAAALLFIFYPGKGRFIVWCIVWSLLIAALPLLTTPLSSLSWQYQNWLHLLANDHSGNYGYSFMGILHSWFGLSKGKDLLVLLGLGLMLIPLFLYKKQSSFHFRLNWFAALLIWLVIFNHKAESPTFIVAFVGIALWFFTSEKNKTSIALAVFAFVFTSLAPTDLFPPTLKHNFFEPFAIKALPCVMIWIYLVFGLMKEGIKKIE